MRKIVEKMDFEKYKPVIVMIGLQFLYAGTTVLSKAAIMEGMSTTVFVVYRQCIAFLLMAPFAYFSRKGSNGACLNWKSFCSIFLLSLVGVTGNQNTSYMALSLISSSVTSAMYNLAPAITFVIAYILGFEKIDVRSWGSIGKIVGTIVCVSGAASFALVKGPKLLTLTMATNDETWLMGWLLALASPFCWSIALILQVNTNKMYPDLVSLTAWMCLMAAFQSGIFAVIMEPTINAWKLTSPIQIFACFSAGVTSATAGFSQSWCVARRGPVFSSMFQPLCTLIITLFGSIFLHEDLYLGSVVSGVVVISGLYMVLWGKAKDYKEVKEEEISRLDSEASHTCTLTIKLDLEEPLLAPQTKI